MYTVGYDQHRDYLKNNGAIIAWRAFNSSDVHRTVNYVADDEPAVQAFIDNLEEEGAE